MVMVIAVWVVICYVWDSNSMCQSMTAARWVAYGAVAVGCGCG